jgi:uncharacterized protein YkwD
VEEILMKPIDNKILLVIFISVFLPLGMLSLSVFSNATKTIPFQLQQAETEKPLSTEEICQQAEKGIFEKTNELREQKKLDPLLAEVDLKKAAEDHSQDMLKRNYLGHFSPEGKSPLDRLAKYQPNPRRSIGENVHMIKSSHRLSNPEEIAQVMIQDWLGSPEHRRNLLSKDFEFLGVGCASIGKKIDCTQVFGGKIHSAPTRAPGPKSDLDR